MPCQETLKIPYEVSYDIEFSAAHRLVDQHQCGSVHNHNYLVRLRIERYELDSNGMVIDFAELENIVREVFLDDFRTHPDLNVTVHSTSPTAELTARLIYERMTIALVVKHPELRLIDVLVQENNHCSATYRP